MENLTCESYYGSGPTKKAECCNGVRLVSKKFASVVRGNIRWLLSRTMESPSIGADSGRRFFASHPSNDNVVFANGSEIYHHEPTSSIGPRSTTRGVSWLIGCG